MSQVIRRVAVMLIAGGLVFGAAGCGIVPLPDRTDLPDITLPTAFPTRDSDDGTGQDDEAVEPEAPPAEPEPEPEPEEPEPEAVPDEPETDAAADDAASTPWWPFVLAGIIVVAIIVAVIALGRPRRDWEKRLTSVHADLRWLDESLVPEVLAKPSTAEASVAWQGARPRVLRMDEELFALQTAGVGDERTARAAADLQALRGLVNAIDAETSTQGATDAEQLRVRRAAVEQARADLRSRITGATP